MEVDSLNLIGTFKGSDLPFRFSSFIENKEISGIFVAKNLKDNTINKINLFKGKVREIKSTKETYNLGNLLIKKGLIKESELEFALSLQQKNNKIKIPIGSILVSMGVISKDIISKLSIHRMEILLYEILLWEAGEFYFNFIIEKPEEQSLSQTQIDKMFEKVEQGIDIESLKQTDFSTVVVSEKDSEIFIDFLSFIKSAVNNLTEIIVIKQKLGNFNAIPVRNLVIRDAVPTGYLKILNLVNGKNTINDIITLALDIDYFQAHVIIDKLHDERYISIPGKTISKIPKRVTTNESKKIESYSQRVSKSLSAKGIITPRTSFQTTLKQATKFVTNVPTVTIGQEGVSTGKDLLEVIYKLQLKVFTGIISIKKIPYDITAEILIEVGNIVWVRIPSIIDDNLEKLLLEIKIIRQRDFDIAKKIQRERRDHPEFERALILARILSLEELIKFCHQLISVLFYEITFWDKIEINFNSEQKLNRPLKWLEPDKIFDTGLFLKDVKKNLPVLALMRQYIPKLNYIPYPKHSTKVKITDFQEKIFKYINGERKLLDIFLISDMDYFQIFSIFYQLLSMNVIEFS